MIKGSSKIIFVTSTALVKTQLIQLDEVAAEMEKNPGHEEIGTMVTKARSFLAIATERVKEAEKLLEQAIEGKKGGN